MQNSIWLVFKKVDKIDVDKLKTVPVDLKKLFYVVISDIVKKTVYNETVKTLMLFRILILGLVIKIRL